jgi:hypothetical protein
MGSDLKPGQDEETGHREVPGSTERKILLAGSPVPQGRDCFRRMSLLSQGIYQLQQKRQMQDWQSGYQDHRVPLQPPLIALLPWLQNGPF